MKNTFLVGAAVAGMIAASTITTVASADNHEGKGHCMGGNACKGKSGCKTDHNGCKGQNGCKGKGWTEMTKAECEKAKGKFEEPKKK